MAISNIPKLRLYEDYFDTGKYTDENSLERALMVESDKLSLVITHLVGREDKRFPLSYLTEGQGRTKVLNSIEYDWPVLGRLDQVDLCTNNLYSAGEKPGVDGSTFLAVFGSKWFVRQYLVESQGQYQCVITEEPYQDGAGNWVYTLKLANGGNSSFLPISELDAGKKWGQMFAPVASSGSHGNESRWVAPSRFTNQITTVRKSYAYEGNVQNKTVNVELNVGGKKTTMWYPFERWQHMLKWKQECEALDFYSRYNRNGNGEVSLTDANGKPVPTGSGILEQIPNHATYSRLSATKLKNVVRDALFGASDSSKMNIVLFTGLGGMEEFDNAMKESSTFSLVGGDLGEKFVQGGPRDMIMGGFFTRYRHIDGHEIQVRHTPLFDKGPRAAISPAHPITGLPQESYRMVFLDMSVYDGQPNVVHVHQKGRNLLQWAVAGATIPNGFGQSALRASDNDGASVHFLKTSGKCIMRATNCLHLEYLAS